MAVTPLTSVSEENKPANDAESTDSSSCSASNNTQKPFDTDVILGHLGFGWFQIKMIVVLFYGILFPTAAVLIYPFIGFVPRHRCFVEGCDDRSDPQYLADWMDPSTVENLLADAELPRAQRQWSCHFMDLRGGASCYVNDQMNGTCNDWIYDRSLISSSVVTDYGLVCDDAWKVSFASFSTLIGLLIGAFVFAPIPDLIGRRKSVALFVSWLAAFGIACNYPPNYEGFVILRCLAAMGGQSMLMSLHIWGTEAMTPNLRFKFFTLMTISQTLGCLLSGLFAYFLRDWQNLQLCIFFLLVLTIVSFFVLPESPRWLVSKKRYAEAKEIFLQIAKMNKKTIPDYLLIIPLSPDKTQNQEKVPDDQPDRKVTSSPFKMMAQILKTPCLLKRTLVFSYIWFAYLLTFFGLSFASVNLSDDIYLNYTLTMVVELPANILAYFAVEKFGRRANVIFDLIGSGVTCLVAGLVSKDYIVIVVVFSLMGKFFCSMMGGINTTFTLEMFPTAARGITLALCVTFGKLGSVISPFIAALGEINPTLPYIIFGGVSLLAGGVSIFLPETKGLPLPSSVQDAVDMEETRLKFSAVSKINPASCLLRCRKNQTFSPENNL